MYLHKDKELFSEVIEATSNKFGLPIAIVEKDYYVTMILKFLNRKNKNIVFKGGTSLSKCFHVINRFSEDIDITFTESIGEARRQKIKHELMKEISDTLGLEISNWNEIRSKAKYNCYIFEYKSLYKIKEERIYPGVKLETALSTYAFPTVEKEVDSYVREFLNIENKELIKKCDLDIFKMKVQAMERTFIDKIFALCDYYLQGKSKRYSRHLYDIYKLNPYIKKDEKFKNLVKEVRKHRETLPMCLSAKRGQNIRKIVYEFCKNDFYKKDYKEITGYFANDKVLYKDTVKCVLELVDKGYFDE